MSFEKIRYVYNPPPTVPPAAASSNTQTSPGSSSSKPAVASALSSRLNALASTAGYLESLILARTSGLGVDFDLTQNPDLAQALSRIYQTDTPPGAISVSMYNHLLDAELGVERAELTLNSLGNQDSVVSPVQKADLRTATKVFEQQIATEGDFQANLTSFLRQLKGDRMIFDYLQQGLDGYPAANHNAPTALSTVATPPPTQQPGAAPPATISIPADVDPDTAANLSDRMDAWQKTYAGIYDLTVQADMAYLDIASIARKYIDTPLAELLAVISMLRMLMATFHRPKLKDLQNAMTAFVFPRLVSELSIARFAVDRLAQKVVSPVQRMLTSFGRLFAEIQNVSNEIGYLVNGGFTGLVQSAASGSNRAPAPSKQAELDAVPEGLASLCGHLSWSLQQSQIKADRLESNMIRAIDRKLNHSGDQIEVLQSMRSIEALVDITRSFSSALSSGTLSPQNVPQSGSSLAAFNSVISGLRAGSNTTFTVQNNQMVPVSPALPAPPAGVETVLVSGGSSLTSSSTLSSPGVLLNA